MTIKPGVDISQLHPTLEAALVVLDQIWPAFFPDDTDGLNVTSGHEHPSVHSDLSRHYIKNTKSGKGEAFDVRIKDVPQHEAHLVATALWIILMVRFTPQRFKIYNEGALTDNAHLHVQMAD